jgi:hypothetical protein
MHEDPIGNNMGFSHPDVQLQRSGKSKKKRRNKAREQFPKSISKFAAFICRNIFRINAGDAHINKRGLISLPFPAAAHRDSQSV